MNILVVIEHSQGSIHRLSKEAIVGAQNLGDRVTALVIGGGSGEAISFFNRVFEGKKVVRGVV